MHWTFTLLFCFSTALAVQEQYNFSLPWSKRLYTATFFGDSTSDTGNVFDLTAHTWPISPPYYDGRYCDSLNWVDRLNVLYKRVYAYGSATTDSTFVQGLAKLNQVRVPGIRQQVAEYLSDTSGLLALSRPFNAHFVWGGGNDIIFNSTLAQNVVLIVNSLMNSVKDLLAAGANNIVLFNQAPLQAFPFAKALGPPQVLAALTAISNNAINSSLQNISRSYPNAKIYLFHLNRLVTELLANPPSPIINTTANCWDNGNITTVKQYCSNPTTYFFLDTLHFSSTIQQKLADAVNPFFLNGFTPNTADSYFYAY